MGRADQGAAYLALGWRGALSDVVREEGVTLEGRNRYRPTEENLRGR